MKQEKKAVCTIAMIVINITIFLVLSFQGMTEDGIFMFHHGAMYVPSMLEEGNIIACLQVCFYTLDLSI